MNLVMRILEYCRFPMCKKYYFVMLNDPGESVEETASNAINLLLSSVSSQQAAYYIKQFSETRIQY